MMNGPFYTSYADMPSRPRTVKEIPVQFVGAERKEIRSTNRSESALKIQKVLRGFLVRKSVKKIAEIRAEVEEIEKRMSEEEMVELIGRDSKERLRVNETLMSLLFKLDSVRGVDSGVRDFRKAVIKRVIALQERLDSVASNCNRSNDNADQTLENDENHVHPTAEDEPTDVACDDDGTNQNVDQTEENDGNHVDPSADEESTEVACNADQNKEDIDQTVKGECDEVIHDYCPDESLDPSQTESGFGTSSSYSVDPQLCDEKEEVGIEEKEESVRNRELLLEKMVEDNEKMMELMAQLFERNAMQTRLLSTLSQRVDQLERAYLCDRLRRKKKRLAAAGTVDGCDDLSTDANKSGKR